MYFDGYWQVELAVYQKTNLMLFIHYTFIGHDRQAVPSLKTAPRSPLHKPSALVIGETLAQSKIFAHATTSKIKGNTGRSTHFQRASVLFQINGNCGE